MGVDEDPEKRNASSPTGYTRWTLNGGFLCICNK